MPRTQYLTYEILGPRPRTQGPWIQGLGDLGFLGLVSKALDPRPWIPTPWIPRHWIPWIQGLYPSRALDPTPGPRPLDPKPWHPINPVFNLLNTGSKASDPRAVDPRPWRRPWIPRPCIQGTGSKALDSNAMDSKALGSRGSRACIHPGPWIQRVDQGLWVQGPGTPQTQYSTY